MNFRFALMAVASLTLVACGGAPQESQTEQPATQEQGLGGKLGPIGGGTCGSNTCASDEYCCNASCGTCVPFGWSCTQQVCDTATLKAEEPVAEASLGQPCGGNTCGSGEFCCNESCGICAPKGGFCTQQACTTPAMKTAPTGDSADESITLERPCGSNTCGSGEFCCNASCGICAPKGGSCTQQYCPPAV